MLNLLEKHRCFNGHQEIYSHGSFSNKCKMQFALYTPDKNENIPVLYFLSGITCTEQNFIQKSGYQKFASEHQMAIVVPDTSPRGKGIPDSESMDEAALEAVRKSKWVPAKQGDKEVGVWQTIPIKFEL